MKQYVYGPSVIGRENWPPGELRLEGFEKTDNPHEADVFVVPGGLRCFPMKSDLYAMLPHFRGNEARHVLFDISDDEQLYGLPCMFFRGNVRPWYLKEDPNSISTAWPVEDYAECIELPEGGFKYDVSFQGWVTSHETREISTQSFINTKFQIQCDFNCYTDFFGYRKPEDPEFNRRRYEFRRSMRESRIALCPESISGVFPYRFFEALSAGRVPLLVGDDFVFPWADRIPYDQFIIRCPRAEAKHVDVIAYEFLRTHTDEQIVSMGHVGRSFWNMYLNAAHWPKIMALAVEERINALCTSPS